LVVFDLFRDVAQEQDMIRPVFRFAPSPNGHLHLGHAYSALLNARMADEAGGRFLVRMEDTDQTRCTREFAVEILEDLAWLGLEWEQPVRVQSEHLDDYRLMLEKLWSMGAIYPCFCSRKEARRLQSIDPDGHPLYAGRCRSIIMSEAQRLIVSGAPHGWRLDMSAVGDAKAAVWGDVVIAKPHIGSSYHIAVVTDDAIQGVTHVVRGMDIEAATPIHHTLQRLLDLPSPNYFHHKLILDNAGLKLSKSAGSPSLRNLRAEGWSAANIRGRLGFS
jgi:glutamyl-Q tRNA(Asp) synthetase